MHWKFEMIEAIKLFRLKLPSGRAAAPGTLNQSFLFANETFMQARLRKLEHTMKSIIGINKNAKSNKCNLT